MLRNGTVSYLKKHSWVSYENKEDRDGEPKTVNKSQTFIRIKNQSNAAFEHLSLLAEKLPEDKFIQVFNKKNISKLLLSMQKFKTDNQYPELVRSPDLGVAEFLVQFGLDIIIKEYKKLSWYTPEIAQLTLDHLLKTKAICHDISLSAETTNLETEASQNQRQYLFTWKRISKEDRQRFQNFVFGLLEKKHGDKKINRFEEMIIRYFSKGTNQLNALIMRQVPDQESYEEDYEKDDPLGMEKGRINFVMNIPDSVAKLTIYFLNQPIEKTLIMEYRNDDYYFYDKAKQ